MESQSTTTFSDLNGMKIYKEYKLINKLGQGSFGLVYSAKSAKGWVAVKLEKRNCDEPLLETEAYIMDTLRDCRIPKVISYGYSGNYNVLIMELLGSSLEDILKLLPEQKFSVKDVCKLGYQMIGILQEIHDKNYIHKDIKPSNFLLGLEGKNSFIYLADFGLASKYRDPETKVHFKQNKNLTFEGTRTFASIHALKGESSSRRDDIESVWYTLLYLIKGFLPWENLIGYTSKETLEIIIEEKKSTTSAKLFNNLPPQFAECMRYIRSLTYEAEPDYLYLKSKLLEVLKESGSPFNYDFDFSDILTIVSDENLESIQYNNEEDSKTYKIIGQSSYISIHNDKTNNNKTGVSNKKEESSDNECCLLF